MHQAKPVAACPNPEPNLEEQSARAGRILTLAVSVGLACWLGTGALVLAMVWRG